MTQCRISLALTCNGIYKRENMSYIREYIRSILQHNEGSYSPKDWKCMFKYNILELSRNHCCSGKTLSITYSELWSLS